MAEASSIQGATDRSTAGDRVVLRPVERDDAAGVHDLLRATFLNAIPDRPRWYGVWLWKHWENPWRRGRPAGWVLTRGDRIVGHLGAVYVPYRIGMDVHTAMIGADFAVAEDAARQGRPLAGLELAGRFFGHSEALIPLATTANGSTQAVFARHGCRPVAWTREFWRAPVTLSQKIRTFHGAGSRLARRMLTGFSGDMVRAASERGYRFVRHQPRVPVPVGLRLDCAGSRDLRMLLASYESRELREGAIGVYHCRAWFEWRYLRHPEAERYHAIVLRDDTDASVAWAIVALDQVADRRQATVMEVHVPASSERLMLTLMCGAMELAGREGAEYLVTQTGRLAWRDFFWELGFASRTRSAPAVAMRLPDHHITSDQEAERLTFWHGEMF